LKPFSGADENVLKQGGLPSPSTNQRGKAMTEAVMALSVFFSVSIFLAHAFDAYRMRGVARPDRQ
jgi:hypothetical protein